MMGLLAHGRGEDYHQAVVGMPSFM